MLAIVIPYFKITFFEATLQSLAGQTDKRFKVYIGDDASPEDPKDLLEQFQGKFDFSYHRFETNLGGSSLTQQWERCIALSENEPWLMILGDDDYLEETVVASWHKHYDTFNNKASVIRFASKTVDEITKSVTQTYKHPIWETAVDSFYRRFKGETRSSLSEHVFSKESFLKHGFSDYPLAWHSDDKAWIAFSDDKPIYTINDCIIYIRISTSSITGKLDNNDLKNLASVQFLNDIIVYNIQLFTKQQRSEILHTYERAIKRCGVINMTDWFTLSKLNLKHFNLIVFMKFIVRFMTSTFRL